jgi:hypothetical protein
VSTEETTPAVGALQELGILEKCGVFGGIRERGRKWSGLRGKEREREAAGSRRKGRRAAEEVVDKK